MANLSALAAARSQRAGEIVYVSEEGHGSMEKAARVIGFPEAAIRRVAVDDRLRMTAPRLDEAISADRARGLQPLFVCANAGTTNTGAIDPLDAIADVCREQGAWFHVDGAYGGFAAVTREGRALLEGMERADSITLDPHKWLYCPMGVGCLLVRDSAALTGAFRAHGEYLKDLPKDEVNFLDRGPELSRPARALSVWMLLRSAGADAIREQIEEDLRLARLAAQLIEQDPRFEIAQEPGVVRRRVPVACARRRIRRRARPARRGSDGALARLRRDDALHHAPGRTKRASPRRPESPNHRRRRPAHCANSRRARDVTNSGRVVLSRAMGLCAAASLLFACESTQPLRDIRVDVRRRRGPADSRGDPLRRSGRRRGCLRIHVGAGRATRERSPASRFGRSRSLGAGVPAFRWPDSRPAAVRPFSTTRRSPFPPTGSGSFSPRSSAPKTDGIPTSFFWNFPSSPLRRSPTRCATPSHRELREVFRLAYESRPDSTPSSPAEEEKVARARKMLSLP